MDVPKSDLGDVIAWSLRGGRAGRGRGRTYKSDRDGETFSV